MFVEIHRFGICIIIIIIFSYVSVWLTAFRMSLSCFGAGAWSYFSASEETTRIFIVFLTFVKLLSLLIWKKTTTKSVPETEKN